jgi:hypothetical protein
MPRRSRYQQVRPNRRFARLLPAALATVALAGASAAGPSAARADTQRAAHSNPPAKVSATVPPATTPRTATRQPNAAGR